MAGKQISFKKKANSTMPYIPGSRPSVQNAQLLVSSGIPSLDAVVGGGLAVSSLIFVEEDTYGNYAKLLVKYFMAEGIVSGHSVFIGSQDTDVNKLVQELPAPVNLEPNPPATGVTDEKMTIAWRYQNIRSVETSSDNTIFGHNFDLNTTLDAEIIKTADVYSWNGNNPGSTDCSRQDVFQNAAYEDLLKSLHSKIKQNEFSISSTPERRNVLRIALHCLASPLWQTDQPNKDLAIFFYNLRALLRSSYAVCLVTVPSHLIQDKYIISCCKHCSDIALRLESFAGSSKETNPAFRDYHGLFHLDKLGAFNTLAPYQPETSDLAFKLRRKKLVIELSGLALVVLGAMLLTDIPRVLLSRLLGSTNPSAHPFFYYIALGFMGTGILISTTAVLGFWAACLHSYFMLAMFLFLLVIMLLGESTLGVLAVLCPEYLGVTVTVVQLVESLQRTYGVPGKEQFTAAIDLAQTMFQCCGISGSDDYDMSWWRLRELGQPELFVPRSCCILTNSLQDKKAFLDPHPQNMSACQSVEESIFQLGRHTEGCFHQLETWFRYHTTLFLAIGSGLVLVELSVLLSAILVCLKLPNESDPVSS